MNKIFKCRFCGKICENSRKLAGHTSKCSLHPKLKEILKKQTSSRLLNMYGPIIEKSYICELCGKIVKYLEREKVKGRRTRFCSQKCANTFVSRSTNNREKYNKVAKTLSKTLLEQYKNGKVTTGGFVKYYFYKNIKVHGTFELRACKILDKMKELKLIKNWEYTKDRVLYVGIDDKNHTYLLDFKVFDNSNNFYYIETKGYKTKIDDLKWKAAKDKGLKLEIWFRKTIEKYEKEFNI